jgi:hypothetical protein
MVQDAADSGAPWHEQSKAILYCTQGELYTVSKHGADPATLAIWDNRWLFSTDTIKQSFFPVMFRAWSIAPKNSRLS